MCGINKIIQASLNAEEILRDDVLDVNLISQFFFFSRQSIIKYIKFQI
jgi:hypothetical protein